MKLLFIVFLAISLHASMQSRMEVVMGTYATITLDMRSNTLFESTFATLREVDGSLSSYKKESVISQLNRHKSARLDRYAYEALLLSKAFYKKSDGYFDITVGAITKRLYHFGEGNFIPHSKVLQRAKMGIGALHITPFYATLLDDVTLDLGGMGKGYGVDKACDLLRAKKQKSARVALSGDIRCIGTCQIEIQSPYGEAIFASFVSRGEELGVSTSGNYQRYVKSIQNNHLIDPKRGVSQLHFDSVTLLHPHMPNSALDAYATAASVMPKQKALSFLDSLGVGYIVVLHASRRVIVSSNIENFVTNLELFNFDNTFKKE